VKGGSGRRDPVAQAVARIAAGELVAFPTETIWGLGADASSEAAVARLRAWKGRGEEQPLSVLVTGVAALDALEVELSPLARELAAAFWPGPLTLVLPCRRRFAAGVARADGALGVRCSPHPVAASLARALAAAGVGPVTATSLNRSGEAPARTRNEAALACARAAEGAEAPLLFLGDGLDAGGGRASTVVDLAGGTPRVLRWGAVSHDMLEPMLLAGGVRAEPREGVR
jgi:L-threonylcarbamoyladenylate synthase